MNTLTAVYSNRCVILNSTFFAKIILPFLVFAVMVGSFLNYTDSSDREETKQCNIDLTQECVVLDNGQQISVRFLQKIEVEEELLLTITVPNNTKIEKMWVQGINMYMGKNAVLSDSVYVIEEKKVYNGRLFLGSCSEPLMRWQLVIKTINNDELEQSWFFNFSTNRNKKAEG
ncbi:MAG: hypothetical protein ACI936_000830 [Paraglaciecola sp.]